MLHILFSSTSVSSRHNSYDGIPRIVKGTLFPKSKLRSVPLMLRRALHAYIKDMINVINVVDVVDGVDVVIGSLRRRSRD